MLNSGISNNHKKSDSRTLRIAVNTIYLVPGSGEEDYFLRCLLKGLARFYPEVELILFTDPVNDSTFASWHRICLEGADRDTRFTHIEGMIEQAIQKEKIDRLLTPYLTAPVHCSVPVIPFIMEPESLVLNSGRNRTGINRKPRDFARIAHHATAILVPTEFARKYLLKTLEIPLNKMLVTPPGVDHIITSPQPCSIEKPYLLAVGPTHPHRNIDRLLLAFERLRNKIPHNLVVVGEIGEAEPATWGSRVLRIQRCPAEQLAGLYQHCDLVICPLLEPCSGICVLEALFSGARVVAGKVGAIPEVAKSAPLYCDPQNVHSITNTILYGLDEADDQREHRIRSGKQIAGEYTWARCVERVFAAFRRK